MTYILTYIYIYYIFKNNETNVSLPIRKLPSSFLLNGGGAQTCFVKSLYIDSYHKLEH